MPELPSTKVGLLQEGLKYVLRLPAIEFSGITGVALSRPLCAGIVLTTKCNLNCTFCYLDKTTDFEEKLSSEEVTQLIDYLGSWGVKQITFVGGEPLLDENLFDFMAYAKDKGIFVGFSTNGTLLTDENVARIGDARVDRVSISLDGIGKTHNIFRGEGVYEKAINGIQKLRGLKNVQLIINTIIFNQNITELVDLFHMSKENGARFNLMPLTKPSHITSVKTNNINIFDGFWVSDDNLPLLDQILDELKKLKRRHGVLLNQDHFIDLLKEYYRNPSFVNRKCKVSTYSMNFLANGDVGICGFSGVVGNIRDKTPKELWKSKTLKETRLRMRNCRKCLLNCYYTPPLYDLIKDFMIYPAGREVFNAI